MPIQTLMQQFKNTFLLESPQRIDHHNLNGVVHDLATIINAHISLGDIIRVISNNVFRIKVAGLLFYWMADNNKRDGKIILAVQCHEEPLAIIVKMLGKDENYIGKPPFVTDLYGAIIKDLDKSITFMSDETLTIDAFAAWQRLFQQEYKILVFDQEHPAKTITPILSVTDLEKYYNTDQNFKRYQFILSENLEQINEAFSGFDLYRMREVAGQTDRDS